MASTAKTIMTIGLLALVACSAIETRTSPQEPRASAPQSKATPKALLGKLYRYEGDWRVGDCTEISGAEQLVKSDGSWGHDADVKSSDTNDTWECTFAFRDAADAEIWRSPRRIYHMDKSNYLYHWHIDGGIEEILRTHDGAITSASKTCSC